MQTFRHRRSNWLDWLPGLLQVASGLLCLIALWLMPGMTGPFRSLGIGVILGSLFLGYRSFAQAATIWRRGNHLLIAPGDRTLNITDERGHTHECAWGDLRLAAETSRLRIVMPAVEAHASFECTIGAREFENGHTMISLLISRYSAAQRQRPEQGVKMIPFPPEVNSKDE